MSNCPPVVISMTTIPSRVSRLKTVVDSLLAQSWPISEIRLYLPKRYHRFPGQTININEVDPRVTLVEVDKDLGPLTKIAFAVDEFKDQDVLVLACDDDMAYDSGWVARFMNTFEEYPNSCLVQSGAFLYQYAPHSVACCKHPRAQYKGLVYRLKRAVTIGLWKPKTPFLKSGYVDVGEGWGGILVNPKWFDTKFKNIPEEIRLVDDVWISGYLASKRVDIWLIANALRPVTSDIAQTDGLNNIKDPLKHRNFLNNRAVFLMREIFGVWS